MAVKRKSAVVIQPRHAHQERRAIKFFLTNQDTTGTTQYYGYIGSYSQGAGIAPWYIMRLNTVSGAADYLFGENDFDSLWVSRANLPYNSINSFRGFYEKYDIR